MSILHVEFQEGWTGEPVDLVVDGEVRYQGSPRTRTQIGFAESVEIDAGDSAVLELRLPGGASAEVTAPRHESWLGVSKQEDGSVRVVEQPTPFGYV